MLHHALYKYASNFSGKRINCLLRAVINRIKFKIFQTSSVMAKSQTSVPLCSSTLLLLVLLFSFVLVNEARLLKGVQPQSSIEMEIVKVLDDLCVEAVKTGGDGHAATNKALTLEGIKKSGPSPGAGH